MLLLHPEAALGERLNSLMVAECHYVIYSAVTTYHVPTYFNLYEPRRLRVSVPRTEIITIGVHSRKVKSGRVLRGNKSHDLNVCCIHLAGGM